MDHLNLWGAAGDFWCHYCPSHTGVPSWAGAVPSRAVWGMRDCATLPTVITQEARSHSWLARPAQVPAVT